MENKKLVTNLCIIRHGFKILLGKKTRKIGEGLFNGPGGKINEGEDIVGSTIREVEEEVGLKVKNLEQVGRINFEFQDGTQGIVMHIFLTTDFEGEIADSEQMKDVQWFDISKLPYGEMFPDDELWLPTLLEGKKIEAEFIFDRSATPENPGKIISHSLKVVTEIQGKVDEKKASWKIK